MPKVAFKTPKMAFNFYEMDPWSRALASADWIARVAVEVLF